jgi:hypothetical protein
MTDEEWYNTLKPDRLSQKTMNNLPEYSISLPTKTIPGKVWEQNLRWGQPASESLWVICEFVEHPTSKDLLRESGLFLVPEADGR